MSKQKQIDLDGLKIKPEDINKHQEVLSILKNQQEMTHFLVGADDRLNKLAKDGLSSDLISLLRDNWRRLLDGLNKTYFNRNGDEAVNSALDDFSKLIFAKIRIKEEGQTALKEADFFSEREREVRIELQEISSAISQLLEEKNTTKKDDKEGKKVIEKKIQQLEQEGENLLKRVYGTVKPAKISKLLKKESEGRADKRQIVEKNIKLLAESSNFPNLQKEVKELEYLVEAAETVNEVLNQRDATWTQELNAEECLINLEQAVKGKNGIDQLAESYKRLKNSLNIEENKDKLKKKISETVLKMEQKINEARIKSGGVKLTGYFGERGDVGNYSKQVKEKKAKVFSEYGKAKTAFDKILNDLKNSSDDAQAMNAIEGVISELMNVNLEETYLEKFYQAIEELDKIIDSYRKNVKKQKLLEEKEVLRIEEGKGEAQNTEKTHLEFPDFMSGLNLPEKDKNKLIEMMNELNWQDAIDTAKEVDPNCEIPDDLHERTIKELMKYTPERLAEICAEMERPVIQIELDNKFNEKINNMNKNKHYTSRNRQKQEDAFVEGEPYRKVKKGQRVVTIVDGTPRPKNQVGAPRQLGARREYEIKRLEKKNMELIDVHGNMTLMLRTLREAEQKGDNSVIIDNWEDGNGTITILNPKNLAKSRFVAASCFFSGDRQADFDCYYPTDVCGSDRGRASVQVLKF